VKLTTHNQEWALLTNNLVQFNVQRSVKSMRSVHHSLTALKFLYVFEPASGVLDLLRRTPQ
jgi:hypothetical protein